MRGGSGAADIWPATGAGQWDYLQIYPVYIRHDSHLAAAPGRHCSTNADCAPGLGQQCRYSVCDSAPIPTTDASGQPSVDVWGSPGPAEALRPVLRADEPDVHRAVHVRRAVRAR